MRLDFKTTLGAAPTQWLPMPEPEISFPSMVALTVPGSR